VTKEQELNTLLGAAWQGDEAALAAFTDNLLQMFSDQGRNGDLRYRLKHQYSAYAEGGRWFLLNFLYGAVDDSRVLVDIKDEWVWLATNNDSGWLPEVFAEKFPKWFLRKVNDHKDRVMRKALKILFVTDPHGLMSPRQTIAVTRQLAKEYLGTPDFEDVINGEWLKEDRADNPLPWELLSPNERRT
jgi:hypothetical protein